MTRRVLEVGVEVDRKLKGRRDFFVVLHQNDCRFPATFQHLLYDTTIEGINVDFEDGKVFWDAPSSQPVSNCVGLDGLEVGWDSRKVGKQARLVQNIQLHKDALPRVDRGVELEEVLERIPVSSGSAVTISSSKVDRELGKRLVDTTTIEEMLCDVSNVCTVLETKCRAQIVVLCWCELRRQKG